MEVVVNAINVAVARILEEWALMMVDPSEAGRNMFDEEAPVYTAKIHFKGPVSGEYQIVCQRSFVETLVSNLLCEESPESMTEEQHLDALKEMANVVAGNLVTETYGKDDVYELSSPQAEVTTIVEVEEFFKRPVFSYLADGEPVAVSFKLDS